MYSMNEVKAKPDEPVLVTLWRDEIAVHRDEVIDFLLSLGDEKKTLFIQEQTDDEYYEACSGLIDRSVLLLVAYSGDDVVGISGLDQRKHGNLGDLLPLIFGYTVVDRMYQGKGLGSRLMSEKNKLMGRVRAFHVMEVTSENAPMRKIVEKNSYKLVHEDTAFAYYCKACSWDMTLIFPLFQLVLSIYLKHWRS
jgi:GNAT superfamily N-acetyltransferase